MATQQEPSDNERYIGVSIYRDTFQFLVRSLRFYKSRLEEEAKVIIEDPDLKALMELRSFREPAGPTPIEKEINLLNRMIAWYEDIERQQGAEEWDYEIGNISHGAIRHLKSICLLYLNHLRNARNRMATTPNMTAQSVSYVDEQIAHFEEKMNSAGVFAKATPIPLLLAQESPQPLHSTVTGEPKESLAAPVTAPIVLSRIPVLDQQLRDRCLDMFERFEAEQQHDRFDQVLGEATRILETRLRGALRETQGVGMKLANKAFNPGAPGLIVSSIQDEQEAVLALFRGIFGHIRNPSHHRLLGEISPQRTMQLIGLIDYAIFLIESATPGQQLPPSQP
jgi:hypothetical protein